MDGTHKDRFSDGKLFRLASQSEALDNYPLLIKYLISNNLSISNQMSANGTGYVVVSLKKPDAKIFRVNYDDYQKCYLIANKLIGNDGYLTPFDVDKKIKAYIMVEFSDRNEF